MCRLEAVLRNDVLRISIHDWQAGNHEFAHAQEQFLKHLEAAPRSSMVVADLPPAWKHLDGDFIRILLNWQRITVLTNRKFRVNGVSQLVTRILEVMAREERSGTATSRTAGLSPPLAAG